MRQLFLETHSSTEWILYWTASNQCDLIQGQQHIEYPRSFLIIIAGLLKDHTISLTDLTSLIFTLITSSEAWGCFQTSPNLCMTFMFYAFFLYFRWHWFSQNQRGFMHAVAIKRLTLLNTGFWYYRTKWMLNWPAAGNCAILMMFPCKKWKIYGIHFLIFYL